MYILFLCLTAYWVNQFPEARFHILESYLILSEDELLVNQVTLATYVQIRVQAIRIGVLLLLNIIYTKVDVMRMFF